MTILYAGLNAANSDCPCIWCQLSKSEFSKSLRTHAMNRKINDKSKGQINDPIIDFIEISNVIVDPLHMYLRVSDKMISLLHVRLESLDGLKFKLKIVIIKIVCFFFSQFVIAVIKIKQKRRFMSFIFHFNIFLRAFLRLN